MHSFKPLNARILALINFSWSDLTSLWCKPFNPVLHWTQCLLKNALAYCAKWQSKPKKSFITPCLAYLNLIFSLFLCRITHTRRHRVRTPFFKLVQTFLKTSYEHLTLILKTRGGLIATAALTY